MPTQAPPSNSQEEDQSKMTLAERITALFTGNSLRINILRDENSKLKAELKTKEKQLEDVEKALEKALEKDRAMHSETSFHTKRKK